MITCEFDRRRFLQWTGAGLFATLSTQLSLESLASAASSSPLPTNTPILVLVTLYGGNDGLNTVVPFTDPTYQSVRSNIALSPSQLLPFTDTLALNASMPNINTLYSQNKVAIVQGVSYPNPNLSHFTSMAIWQSASLTAAVSSGWIGRWLDRQSHRLDTATGLYRGQERGLHGGRGRNLAAFRSRNFAHPAPWFTVVVRRSVSVCRGHLNY
jgi:uncharacterized protein (DUF1501 family)